uniref:Uncharacterized protein n=1 Tax=Sipha flava TaxID=143950 RepID=A0A2S2PYX2_9HEMI
MSYPTNFDDPLQGNIKKLQKLLPVNNILPDKSKSPESNNNIELTLSQSRNSNQYTKYFKHKIKLLNLLRQYKDRVLNTLSYCCIECDIICEEKPIWDKHNETKHMSHSTRTTIFCSTCSMLIVGENANDHNGTMEHCILLKFIQSLKPVEEDLIQKTKIMDTVKNSTSINKETEKQQLEMKIVGSTKECQYPVKSIKINVGSHTTQKASLLNKESLVMNNTLPPKDMNDQNKYEINSRTSNPVKLNEITSTHSYSLSTSSTVVYQEDVEIKKHKNMNCIDIINKDNLTHEVDKEIFCEPHTQIKTEISEDIEPDNKVASISSLSTAPLLTHVSNFFNTEQASTFNEDKAYGKYITMRLQHFKDETVKKNIILETFNFINKKVVPEPIDNGTPTNEGPLITYSNLLNPSLTNMLSENVDGINLQEDLNYGKYVTLRLRNIKNKKLKQDIKLEIDNIFYVKMRQSVI